MAEQFPELSQKHIDFIAQQKLFFVGTATDSSRVNISPKGMDSFRVLDKNSVAWLNFTGSGNETAAHIQSHPRMTIMFTSFDKKPLTLRLYGEAMAIHRNDTGWSDLLEQFSLKAGARQIFKLSVDLVQTSCGFSIPYYDYAGEREVLNTWAEKQGEKGIEAYWEKKNQRSIDGIATHILDKNIS